MMLRTRAYYEPQMLRQSTVDEFSAEWVLLAQEFTVAVFRDALTEIRRESEFFPRPPALRRRCEALAKMRRLHVKAQSQIRRHDEARDQWLRDYADDVAAGVARKPLSEDLRVIAAGLGLVVDVEGERDAAAAA